MSGTCHTCRASWSGQSFAPTLPGKLQAPPAEGHWTWGCVECGDGALQGPCADCLGACGVLRKRAEPRSWNAWHRAHWRGEPCREALSPTEQRARWAALHEVAAAAESSWVTTRAQLVDWSSDVAWERAPAGPIGLQDLATSRSSTASTPRRARSPGDVLVGPARWARPHLSAARWLLGQLRERASSSNRARGLGEEEGQGAVKVLQVLGGRTSNCCAAGKAVGLRSAGRAHRRSALPGGGDAEHHGAGALAEGLSAALGPDPRRRWSTDGDT